MKASCPSDGTVTHTVSKKIPFSETPQQRPQRNSKIIQEAQQQIASRDEAFACTREGIQVGSQPEQRQYQLTAFELSLSSSMLMPGLYRKIGYDQHKRIRESYITNRVLLLPVSASIVTILREVHLKKKKDI